MSHFAKVENGLVTGVIVAEQDFIDTGLVGDPALWVQTSYNTRGGVHYGPDGQPDGGVALRKNYAGMGYIYDPVRDAFYAPQPWPSWQLNEASCQWEPPMPYPADLASNQGAVWDESTVSWQIIELPNQNT